VSAYVKVAASYLEALISSSQSRFDLWVRILRSLGSETVAEIGVWKGDFANAILLHCEAIRRYYMIDPWAHLSDWDKPLNVDAASFERVRDEAIAKTAFAAAKLTILRGRTSAVIEQIPDASLDFGYVDGDHTLRGITIDLIKLLPKMKEGGIIGGDDFAPTWKHGFRFEPTLVFPFAVYFAEAMNLPIVAMPHRQFLIQKTRNSSFSFVDMVGTYTSVSMKELLTGEDRLAAPEGSDDDAE
jgi:hypothetical protein